MPIDAARCAAQSDPDLNFHFSRRWREPIADQPPPRRERDDAEDALRQTGADRQPQALPREVPR